MASGGVLRSILLLLLHNVFLVRRRRISNHSEAVENNKRARNSNQRASAINQIFGFYPHAALLPLNLFVIVGIRDVRHSQLNTERERVKMTKKKCTTTPHIPQPINKRGTGCLVLRRSSSSFPPNPSRLWRIEYVGD